MNTSLINAIMCRALKGVRGALQEELTDFLEMRGVYHSRGSAVCSVASDRVARSSCMLIDTERNTAET